MSMFMARSAALAGAIAGGVLCQALVSQPAHADYYAFGNTQNYVCSAARTGGCAELTLGTGSTQFKLFTDGYQGWIGSPYGVNIGGPVSINTSYLAGYTSESFKNDYFAFNVGSVSPRVKITSATLTVYSGAVSNDLEYSLFAASQWLSDISTASSPNPALYQEMMTGMSYGSFLVHANTKKTMSDLVFTLNLSAVEDINTAIEERGEFGIAGHVAPLVAPEPSTWLMMLAGFAGLGVAARRRAARRRAAAPAR
jgi:hypothetical protein